jgi:hypothetical protein
MRNLIGQSTLVLMARDILELHLELSKIDTPDGLKIKPMDQGSDGGGGGIFKSLYLCLNRKR